MDKYYYFVAQLPTQFFGKETDITSEKFLTEAEKWLDVADYSILSRVDINNYLPDKRNPRILQGYQHFEEQLRTDIARFREARKKETDYKPAAIPAAILKEGNPLQVEQKLLELRWNVIDEMQRDHHFDLAFLILYYLKLQILTRYFTFNKEEGMKKFQQLCEVSL
ncbi:MAG TPA: DUF2764 family protein [bacterium]|mgnify:CR=1 FL=1|nr:DUF2764 family protein [bacterium]